MIELTGKITHINCPFCDCIQCYTGRLSAADGNFGGVRIELII
jgi:hypothetical protein